jgi:import inner membrane translocase subunit TIM50
MLSRAAIRTLRITPSSTSPSIFPRTASIASTAQRSRFYANKPGRDNTWKTSDPIKFGEEKQSSDAPVNPGEQPEFDAAAAPERNTTPDAPDGPQEPQKPLPDLRQGIPSTFADEIFKAQAQADAKAGAGDQGAHDPNVTDDPAKEPGSGPAGREGGQLPKSAYETSTDRRRNKFANWSYLISAFLAVTGAVFVGRPWETEEEEKANPDAPQGWTPALMYKRAHARLNNQMGYYTEPTFPKLLPDMDPAPPLTLVLSLEDLLVFSEWTTRNGWRTAKRPGVDYFLRYLSQYYELVIFTSVKMMDAEPIIRKLDPFQMVMWPLFREATRYEKGEYIKDLSCLNRDLSKTIIIDTDPSHVKLQPENAIILPKWKGTPGDKGLVALIPFLEYLAMLAQGSNLDVRQALKAMEGKEIPAEYARREAKLRTQFHEDLEKEKKKKGKAGGFLMGQLGMGKQGAMILSDGTNVSEGMAQGKMMIDMFRDIGRRNYEDLDNEIRTNGQKYLKEREEEEKKMQEEQMKSMKTSAFGWLSGAPPPPGAPPAAPTTPQ